VVSSTVKPTGQLLVLPALSTTVMVIVDPPRGAIEPAGGDCVMIKLLSQVSAVTTKAVTSGTTPWQLAEAFTVCSGAQVVMIGAVVSTTVKRTVQVSAFPAALVAVSTTAVLPNPTSVLAAGNWLTNSPPHPAVATN
jgi:hypothetical protein